MSLIKENIGTNPMGSPVNVPVSGRVSNNMPPSPLAPNATYVIDWFPTSGYITLFFFLYSDQVGSLKIEWSEDGNKISANPITVGFDSKFAGKLPRVGAFAPRASFARLTYTNGSTAQKEFSFMAELLTTQAQPSLETLLDDLADTRLAMVTKTVLQAKDTNGVYDFIYRVNNAMRVSVDNPTAGPDNGTDATAVSPLAGGSGIRGWLSSVYQRLTNGTQTTQLVDGNNLPYGTQTKPFNVAGNFYQATQPISGSVKVNNDSASPIPVIANPSPTGGLTIRGYYQPSGSGALQLLSAGMRKLGEFSITNTNTGPVIVMIYDLSATPKNTDTFIHAYVVPGGAVFSPNLGDGMHFNNGIGVGVALGSNLASLVTLLLSSITAGSVTINYSAI